jgi:hypothetical protein
MIRKAKGSGRRFARTFSSFERWAKQDLNLCPLPCKGSALSN